jgi:hypothetical protein
MWHLVWRHDRQLSLPARTFLAELRSTLGVRRKPRL